MNPEQRSNIIRNVLLSIWAMATVVLVVCLALVVRAMLENGQNPLSSVATPGESAQQAPAQRTLTPTVGTREVTLYFCSPDGRSLVGETRRIEFTPYTTENCRKALQQLIAGPHELLAPLLPATVRVKAVYPLENGELVVDFSREMVNEHVKLRSATLESILFFGITNTLTQPGLKGDEDQAVQRVRFLFEGAPPPEFFPAHLDLSEPLTPKPEWIRAEAPKAP